MSHTLRIHDWIIDHPWSTGREISDVLSLTKKAVYVILNKWVHDDEIKPNILRRIRLCLVGRHYYEYSILKPFCPPKEGSG